MGDKIKEFLVRRQIGDDSAWFLRPICKVWLNSLHPAGKGCRLPWDLWLPGDCASEMHAGAEWIVSCPQLLGVS